MEFHLRLLSANAILASFENFFQRNRRILNVFSHEIFSQPGLCLLLFLSAYRDSSGHVLSKPVFVSNLFQYISKK